MFYKDNEITSSLTIMHLNGKNVILLPCKTCTYAGVVDFVPRESVTASSTVIIILLRNYLNLDDTSILQNISLNFILHL